MILLNTTQGMKEKDFNEMKQNFVHHYCDEIPGYYLTTQYYGHTQLGHTSELNITVANPSSCAMFCSEIPKCRGYEMQEIKTFVFTADGARKEQNAAKTSRLSFECILYKTIQKNIYLKKSSGICLKEFFGNKVNKVFRKYIKFGNIVLTQFVVLLVALLTTLMHKIHVFSGLLFMTCVKNLITGVQNVNSMLWESGKTIWSLLFLLFFLLRVTFEQGLQTIMIGINYVRMIVMKVLVITVTYFQEKYENRKKIYKRLKNLLHPKSLKLCLRTIHVAHFILYILVILTYVKLPSSNYAVFKERALDIIIMVLYLSEYIREHGSPWWEKSLETLVINYCIDYILYTEQNLLRRDWWKFNTVIYLIPSLYILEY
jgi:hypothetical protein